MSIFGFGLNNYSQSGPVSNDSVSFSDVMGHPEEYPLNAADIQAISCGMYHSVFLMKDGRVFVNGNDSNYRIGHPNHGKYKDPIEFPFDEEIKWIYCGPNYSCYLKQSGKLLLSNEDANGLFEVQYDIPIVFVAGSTEAPVAIDDEGNVLVFKKNSRSPPQKFTFPSPVFDVTRGCSLIFAITTDYQIYKLDLKGSNNEFALFDEFDNIKIVSIAGYLDHYMALSDEGEVYSMGLNSHGQLGIGTKDEIYKFVRVNGELSGKKVKKIGVGGWHSVCLTDEGKLYGFGLNSSYQMSKFLDENGNPYREILLPKQITCLNDNVSDFALGSEFSFYVTGNTTFPHPGRIRFLPDTQLENRNVVKRLYSFLDFP